MQIWYRNLPVEAGRSAWTLFRAYNIDLQKLKLWIWKMKVFLSWSGERSQQFAQAIHDWLPLAVHYVEPWISNSDIEAGERWANEVAKELDASNFGIICLTKDNLSSPWILFEAGALAKSMIEGRVIPLLLDIEFKDVSGPLAQFQSKKYSEKGVFEIISAINKLHQSPIAEKILNQLFETLWPQLEEAISKIPSSESRVKNRPQHEVLEELVSSVRGLDVKLRDNFEEGSSRIRSRRIRNVELMLDVTLGGMDVKPSDPIGIVIITSQIREYFPWIYDLAVELYISFAAGDHPEKIYTIRRQIIQALNLIRRGPLIDIVGEGSKQGYILMKELDRYMRYAENYLKEESSAGMSLTKRPMPDNMSQEK